MVRFRGIAQYGNYRSWSAASSAFTFDSVYDQSAISYYSPAEV
jgi:hypothetical protein